MSLLTVSHLGHAYGSDIVLDDATFSIDPGEKIGLVGRNGSGKTTLLRAILGELHPDRGNVQLARGARIGYLSQDPKFPPGETLRGAAEAAFAELHDLHQKLEAVFDSMAEASSDELQRLMNRQVQLEAQIEAAGGYAIDHKIDATLHGLGFTDGQFSQKVEGLSGGQKNRLGLARLLLEEPDLLLLDEPTNHLDIAGRQWLEDFLADEYKGAVIVVSHDRWLLDRVVSRIIEVHVGAIREYPGNYQKFVQLRMERQLTQARVFDRQMDRIRQEEAYIRKYKAGQRARQAKGRESRLQRFKRDELIDRPMELDVMRLKLPPAPRSGEQVIVTENLTKRYDDLTLFEHVDITVRRGQRIGIIGPNGSGKTTLVRCMLGELQPDEGTARLGSRVKVGYYQQSHEHLDRSLTVWQYLQRVLNEAQAAAEQGTLILEATEQQARDLAGAFLFSGDEQDKLIGDLSGGERSRAVLAGLVASGHNLLVLDEPSNHLDIPSAERLEQALSTEGGYDGTLLLISHDRALLQATCEQLIVLDGSGSVVQFPGTYLQWQDRLKTSRNAVTARGRQSSPDSSAKAKHTGKQQNRQANTPKPNGSGNALAGLSLPAIEAEIEQVERRIAEIDEQLMQPEVFTDGERCRQLKHDRDELQTRLQPLEAEWTRRAESA